MANVFVNSKNVPRIYRNKRVYPGYDLNISNAPSSSISIDWAVADSDLIELLRSVQVDGDLTITNLSGNEGDTPFVDDNGSLGLIRAVLGETPTGTIDNANTIFTIANTPTDGSVEIFKNGQRLTETTDYTITGATITFTNAPQTDTYYTDILRVNYKYVTYLPSGSTGSGLGATVPYTEMTRGSACTSSDLKISRVGRTLTITGTFVTIVNPSAGAIVASVPYADIAQGLTLSTRIYGTANAVDPLDANRGAKFYVETFAPGSTSIEIKILNSIDNVNAAITLTFNIL